MTERNFKTFQEVLWVVFMVALIAFVLLFCCGCTPKFARKYTECAVVAGQVLQAQADRPELVRRLGRGLAANGEKVLEKTGRCGELINAENVESKLIESGSEADAYVPWYHQLPSTGNPIIDALIALVIGSGGLYAGRKPIRGLLHAVTHNGKIGG